MILLLLLYSISKLTLLLYTNIDQKLVNSLHGLLHSEIGVLHCHVITTKYIPRVHCIHMYHLFCNALVHVINSGVSGQCLYTICCWRYSFSSFIQENNGDYPLCCIHDLVLLYMFLFNAMNISLML